MRIDDAAPLGDRDAAIAAEAAAMATRAAAIALPPAALDGWQSLCAAEYAAAAVALRSRLAMAVDALRSATAP